MMVLSRRRIVLAAAGLPIAAGPVRAQAERSMQELVQAFAQGRPVQPGRVTLEVAKLVDNGNTVPVRVTVQSPMTAADHVTEIAIFNEKNPQHEVALFQLGPRAGRADVATRMRLATSQKLVALARLNDGSVWSDGADVVVVLAACIEGEP